MSRDWVVDCWTAEEVTARLAEAADTLRRLRMSGTRPAGAKTNWPSIVQDFWESYDITASPRALPAAPKPTAIDRMDEVIGWLLAIQDATARGVVWGKACGFATNRMAKVLGISRYYVDRLHCDGIERMTKRLNGRL
jgi:hypothetical protein